MFTGQRRLETKAQRDQSLFLQSSLFSKDHTLSYILYIKVNCDEFHKKYTQNSRRDSEEENLISCQWGWWNADAVVSHLSFFYPEVISLYGHFTLFKQMNKTFKLYLAPWTHLLSSAYYPALSHYLQILQISYIFPCVSLHISLLWHMFMSMPRKHFTSFIYAKCHQL